MKRKFQIACIVLGGALLQVACAAEKPQLAIASSAEEVGYARAFPERYDAENRAFDEIPGEARKSFGEMPSYPDAIASTEPEVVRGAYERADVAGRGQAYAEGVAREEAVRTFFEAERDDIGRRVNGAVQAHLAKELTGVEVDVSGQIAYALKEGVSKRIEKQFRSANEAHLYLDAHEAAVGKKDEEKLREQVDALARTSHLVHVAYTERRLRIARFQEELKDVGKTLDRAIEAESARCGGTGLTKPQKQACEANLEELRRAKTRLDEVSGAYPRNDEELNAAHDALKKEYKAAFDALLEAVDAKVRAAPAR